MWAQVLALISFSLTSFQKTWLASLRTKFKMERAKLRDVDDLVKVARATFGRKRKSSIDVAGAGETKRCVRVEVVIVQFTFC